MRILERNAIGTGAPAEQAALTDHLRIESTEFYGMRYALAAARELEDYCEFALLAREIVAAFAPTDLEPVEAGFRLPLYGPVDAATIPTIELIETDGTATTLADGWHLRSGRWPAIIFTTAPTLPGRVTYEAGFGADWQSLPDDLQHAILDQALRLYDRRGDTDAPATLAPSAARIGARYRRVRLGAA